MKVMLTLNRGSFYFMKNVHLVRGVPTEVDLNTLDKVELAGLKLNIQGGTILTDKDVSNFSTKVEPVVVTESTEKVVEEVTNSVVTDTIEGTDNAETVEESVAKETPKRSSKRK